MSSYQPLFFIFLAQQNLFIQYSLILSLKLDQLASNIQIKGVKLIKNNVRILN